MRVKPLALLAVPLVLLATACAPQEDSTSSDGSSSSSSCAKGDLRLKSAGKLTVATDTPAYEPWFSGNDPTNGRGFESAVAYAVADQLGFSESEVSWVKEPFNNSYAPGEKKFDVDINQISVTPAREKVVDFSSGYYTASQGVIALDREKVTPGSLSDLSGLKLGAQTGTTSLTAIRDVIKPDRQPLVFTNTNTAKQALLNGQVDAIVADLPTAFYITSAEIDDSSIVGQFQASAGSEERFGMLLEKDSDLTPCIDRALAALKKDGTLADLQKKWLSDTVDVPVLK